MERRSRLPGVSFQVESPPPEETLPRMDIAAFVGLASAGPLNAPVLIEDPVRFRELFGPDLPLVRDAAGVLEFARLGPTVDAFFRNGGRRCYVVRVTGREEDGSSRASTCRFLLPGLLLADPWQPASTVNENLAGWTPTLATARSEGTWAEALRVGCSLNAQVLFFPGSSGGALTLVDGVYRLELATSPVSPGDLLRLTWLAEGLELLMVVRTVEDVPGQVILSAGASEAWWFSLQVPELEVPEPLENPVQVVWHTAEGLVTLTLPGGLDPAFEVNGEDEGSSSPEYVLTISTPSTLPQPGDVLRVTFEGDRVLVMPLESVEASDVLANALTLRTTTGRWLVAPPAETAEFLEDVPYVELLQLRVAVWHERELAGQLDALRFHPAHAGCWARLPTDAALWQLPPGGAPRTVGPLDAVAFSPRFALAGPGCVTQENAFDVPLPVWLPFGLPAVSSLELTRGPLDPTPPAERLKRDGLETFDADMFLDPALATLGTDALETEAFYRFYVQRNPLLGLHCLLPVEEVSLLSLPDASLRQWHEVTPEVLTLLEAPLLGTVVFQAPTDGESSGTLLISWTASAGATEYQLEQSQDASFTAPQTVYQDVFTSVTLPVLEHCPTVLFYRVRAKNEQQRSPWSDTARVKAPSVPFDPCGETWLIAPTWGLIEGEPGEEDFLLSWSAVPGADRYCIEISTDPAFDGVLEAFLTSDLSILRPRQLPGVIYYRLQAWKTDGSTLDAPQVCLNCGLEAQASAGVERGPWSITWVVNVPPEAKLQLKPIDEYSDSDLLAIQTTALRFAAARADLVVMLSLPLHYRTPEVLRHVSKLVPDPRGSGFALGLGQVNVLPLSFGESRALSYGALYHPWLAVSAQTTGAQTTGAQTRTTSQAAGVQTASTSSRAAQPIFVPPDGPMLGFMAGLTLRQGAWIAPANGPLEGGLALFPPISVADWQALYQAGVNVIRQDARGFSAQGAETLSLEVDLQPLNVRRLMILLRRLCLREGHRLVFAPNSPQLRARVRRAFEQVLSDLFVRGAFAGTSPERAFQVVADDSVNPTQSVDAGRLVLELRVAPSKPLSFITVRLVQQGTSALAVREG